MVWLSASHPFVSVTLRTTVQRYEFILKQRRKSEVFSPKRLNFHVLAVRRGISVGVIVKIYPLKCVRDIGGEEMFDGMRQREYLCRRLRVMGVNESA